MTWETVIRSRTNDKLKRVGAALAGKEASLVLEGERLVSDALGAGLELDLLLVAESKSDWAESHADHACEVCLVEDQLLSRASAMKRGPGVLALAARPAPRDLADLPRGERSLILVVCGVADPGNLGALARSAEAAGASALVTLAGSVSPWNEKCLRGSMGSLLRVPVFEAPDAGAAAAALTHARSLVAATRGGSELSKVDWSGPIALWMGPETGDLPAACAEFEGVTIPMAGTVESLNVTVAASLLLFASGRATT